MPDTNATVADPRELIDHAAIAKANADRDATLAAHREAETALAEAEKALRAATRAADDAAASAASAEAERAVIDAELTLRACQRRAKATAAAAAEAPRLHREAIGRAHRNAAFDAIERRIAACAAAEEADRAKKAAESALALATRDLHGFVNVGCPIRGALDAPQYLRSEADERKYWIASNIDLETRNFFPGERA